MAHGLAGKRRFNGLDLAHALDAGHEDRLQGGREAGRGNDPHGHPRGVAPPRSPPPSATTTSRPCSRRRVEAAERAVAKTPSLLPILREAHVVDSGGQGLFRLFQGALEAARGRPIARRRRWPAARARGASRTLAEPVGRRRGGRVRLRDRLPAPRPRRAPRSTSRRSRPTSRPSGDSVLVAGDALLAKVHVHNERPDAVIAYGLGVGTLSRITIENLDGQAHDVREAKAAAFVGGRGDRPADRRPRPCRAAGSGAPTTSCRARHAARRWASSPSRRRRASRRPRPTPRRRSGSTARSGSSRAARAPTRRPASCSRPSGDRTPTSC